MKIDIQSQICTFLFCNLKFSDIQSFKLFFAQGTVLVLMGVIHFKERCPPHLDHCAAQTNGSIVFHFFTSGRQKYCAIYNFKIQFRQRFLKTGLIIMHVFRIVMGCLTSANFPTIL